MRIEKFTSAIDLHCQWIDRHRNSDGQWKEPSSSAGYFSLVPFANHIGRCDWALAALHLVQERFINGEGLLLQESELDDYIAYVPAWFVWGASKTGNLKFAHQMADFVQSRQCKETGGVFGSMTAGKAGHGAISFDATAMAAVAFARAGRPEASAAVGDFLLRMLEAQPHTDAAFYTDWQQPGGLISDEPAANSALQWDQPKQHYYKMGLFVVALLEAYAATADHRYLDAAITGYRMTADRGADLYTNTLSHKMCWAAFRLFALTFDRRYA